MRKTRVGELEQTQAVEQQVAPEVPALSDAVELRKPHDLLVPIPTSSRSNVTARRIYNVLMKFAQLDMNASGVPRADELFERPLSAILRSTGSSGSDRAAAKRYLAQMRDTPINWESTAPGDGLKFRALSMLAEVSIEVRGGDNWVQWSFPPTILRLIRDPSLCGWTLIDLESMTRLTTYSSVALYEIGARYSTNPSGVTAWKPVEWWINALSPTPNNERPWRKFKSEFVNPAIAEINAETNITIEIVERKDGKRITDVQFKVRRKPGRSKAQPPQPVDTSLVNRGVALGIAESRFDNLLREFGDERVREKLAIIENRSPELRRISDAYAFLRTLLRNDAHAEDLASPPASPPATVQTPDLTKSANNNDSATGLNAITDEKPDTWLEQRIAQLRAEVAALEIDQRQIWVDQALESLANRKILTAVIARQARNGNVLRGVLGSAVIHAYAEATYGPAWSAHPTGG